ncbi:MAG: hypothetical protein UFG06_06815 [Lachnospiraceae bacterium]|nr:hypothetical protein [Lachnospiraceae bacterium]
MEKYNSFKIPVEIILTDKEVEELEEYRRKASEKGLNVSLEKLIAILLETGSKRHFILTGK